MNDDNNNNQTFNFNGPVSGIQIGNNNTQNNTNNDTQNPNPNTIQPALITDKVIHPPLDSTVFISYSRQDWNSFVHPFVSNLHAHNIKIWVDQFLLEGGQNWRDEINSALDICSTMLLILSPDAINSPYVKEEYRYFLHKQGKQLIPILYRDVNLPPELAGIQFLKADNFDVIIDRLKKLGH